METIRLDKDYPVVTFSDLLDQPILFKLRSNEVITFSAIGFWRIYSISKTGEPLYRYELLRIKESESEFEHDKLPEDVECGSFHILFIRDMRDWVDKILIVDDIILQVVQDILENMKPVEGYEDYFCLRVVINDELPIHHSCSILSYSTSDRSIIEKMGQQGTLDSRSSSFIVRHLGRKCSIKQYKKLMKEHSADVTLLSQSSGSGSKLKLSYN